ncbi:MAG TPA: hypothetical protein VFS23_39925 [Vicinamibacterales bacterium]|nr:hypothetical protein [Vicinamibacterales bacterium]
MHSRPASCRNLDQRRLTTVNQAVLTLVDARHHHRNVLVVFRSVAAILIAVLTAGPVGLCAGWQVTAEERMACCIEGVACPMHTSARDHAEGKRAITQAEADGCCAASEGDTSSSAKASIVISPALPQQTILLPAANSSRLLIPRDPAPDRATAVPRHLLNSVFLV